MPRSDEMKRALRNPGGIPAHAFFLVKNFSLPIQNQPRVWHETRYTGLNLKMNWLALLRWLRDLLMMKGACQPSFPYQLFWVRGFMNRRVMKNLTPQTDSASVDNLITCENPF